MQVALGYMKLMSLLKEKIVYPVYLFIQGDAYLQELILMEIASLLGTGGWNGLERVNAAQKQGDVLLLAETPNLGGCQPLVVIDNAQEIPFKRIQEYFRRWEGVFPAPCLVLCWQSPRSDTKLVDLVKRLGVVARLEPLKGQALRQWLSERFTAEGKHIEARAVDFLLSAAQQGMSLLDQEVVKLVLYTAGRKTVTYQDVTRLTVSQETNVFQTIDVIMGGEASQALSKIRDSLSHGQNPVGLVSLLARQVRLIIRAKEHGVEELATIYGLSPWLAQKNVKQASNFSLDELEYLLGNLKATDLALKKGGNPLVLFTTLIANLHASSG